MLTQKIEALKNCGIKCEKKDSERLVFSLVSKNPFRLKVPYRSFSDSVNSLFCALFKHGKSTIFDYTTTPEFTDIVNFLIRAGAKIKKTKDKIEVIGPARIKPIRYKNMNDPHDLVTWISAGLATNSEIEINGIEYEKMGLDILEKYFKKMNVKIDLHSYVTRIKPQLENI